jgi:hypothetical protein
MDERNQPDKEDFDEEELIAAEFESMVAGLSLDESSPTTYLDELDKFEDTNRFVPPMIAKKSLLQQIRGARESFLRWKNNKGRDFLDDGTAL